MKVLFVISSKYFQYDGEIWTTTSYNNEMWKEYLMNFEEIYVFAPIVKVDKLPKGSKRADCQEVKFIKAFSGKNPKRILESYIRLLRVVKTLDGGIIHSPSLQSEVAFRALKKYKKPFIVENRGEQSMHEGFLKAKNIPFPKLVSRVFRGIHLNHLEHSYGCIYVSSTLMEKYKPVKAIKSEVISDFRLPREFVQQPRKKQNGNVLKLINVGSLNPAKDHETLLKAISYLNIENIQLHIVGKGELEYQLKNKSRELGISNQVIFHGFVPWGNDLFKLYEEADLFVLSSITEGMPRVILESLALGLPVISTRVSGSIEVLPKECLFEVGDYKNLGHLIKTFADNKALLNNLSERGIDTIQNYTEDKLVNKKVEFLKGFKTYMGGI